jgi:hypothetical protein
MKFEIYTSIYTEYTDRILCLGFHISLEFDAWHFVFQYKK